MKTTRNDGDVAAFLAGVASPRRREDAARLARIMAEETGADPVMWGEAIVGFGDSEYQTGKGPQPWFRVGFSPRKASLALYGLPEPEEALGPHTTSTACLYIKDLRAVDEDVLRELIRRAAA
jgi:hypothetical protein